VNYRESGTNTVLQAIPASFHPTLFRGSLSDCPRAHELQFDPLPGSQREAGDVVDLWKKTRPSKPVLLSGAAAGEEAVKRLSPGQSILHLATHGFALGSDCETVPGTRGTGGWEKVNLDSPAPVGLDNPLRLAGLALSGANRHQDTPPGQEDGILTAEEVSSLNLSGVDWAVLSACNTATGELHSAEGVLGLRRAFQVAGARTLISSLWPVGDQSTRSWMRALYQARLAENRSTAESVRAASRMILADRRAKKQSTHPFYWAAFVASGRWE
jgi:CHAT domain-containing protein